MICFKGGESTKRGWQHSTAQQQRRERLVGSLVAIMARNSIINFFLGHPVWTYDKSWQNAGRVCAPVHGVDGGERVMRVRGWRGGEEKRRKRRRRKFYHGGTNERTTTRKDRATQPMQWKLEGRDPSFFPSNNERMKSNVDECKIMFFLILYFVFCTYYDEM